MKTNVYYLDQKYNVNEKKRCVHCRLTFGIKMHNIPGIDMLERNDEFLAFMDYITDIDSIGEYDNEKNMFVATVEAMSRCDDSDVFDEDFGRKLALTRAQKHAFSLASLFYQEIKMILAKTLKELNDFEFNCDVSKENCQQHCWDLIEQIKSE